jgi:hypothetical protein
MTVVEPLHAKTIASRRLLEVTDLGNPAISYGDAEINACPKDLIQ